VCALYHGFNLDEGLFWMKVLFWINGFVSELWVASVDSGVHLPSRLGFCCILCVSGLMHASLDKILVKRVCIGM